MAPVRLMIMGFLLCRVLFPAFAIASADVENSYKSGSWRFAIGYAFLNRADELKDAVKTLSRDHGEGSGIYNTSIGLSFQPYYQFANGWRAGPGIGPFLIFLGDAHHVQVPLNLTVGYSFFRDADFSVYCRAGVSWHAAAGDYIAGSRPGGYAAFGMEFLNTRSAHIGLETGWDGAEISLDSRPDQTSHEKIRAGALTIFLYADF